MDPSQQFRMFFRTFLSPSRTIRPHPNDRVAAHDESLAARRDSDGPARPLDAA